VRVSKGGQRQGGLPTFETHRYAMLLRVRWCDFTFSEASQPRFGWVGTGFFSTGFS